MYFLLFFSFQTLFANQCDDYLRMFNKATPSLTFSVDYTTETRGTKTITLPSSLALLKDKKDIKVVSFAGNFHPDYFYTRHNLGFLFYEYLVERLTTRTPRNASFSNFDSTFTTAFKTREGLERTADGEVIYLEDSNLLLVRPLGDYNDTGDFVVSILNYLNISNKNLVHIHDDLDVEVNEVEVVDRQVQKYTGNNSQFSLIRNLAMEFPHLLESVYQKHNIELSVDEKKELVDLFYASVIIRDRNHLGEPKRFGQAIKNTSSVINSLPSKKYYRKNPLLKEEVEGLVNDRLTFSRIAIGTKESEERPEDLPKFVLSSSNKINYPLVFNKAFEALFFWKNSK